MKGVLKELGLISFLFVSVGISHQISIDKPLNKTIFEDILENIPFLNPVETDRSGEKVSTKNCSAE